VEKVVIILKSQDYDHGLIALISALFPECEISTVLSNMEGNNVYRDESSSEIPLSDAGVTMSDVLIVHEQPSMHEIFTQELTDAIHYEWR
jgi:hypothetical protein